MSLSKADEERLALLKSKVGTFPDFPKEGINFKDIFTAFRDGATCAATKNLLLNYVTKNHPNIDGIVGLDARGFLFCFTIASELQIACIPVRKRGKLPGECLKVEYALEYGTDVFEIQKDAIKEGQKFLIVDDLLATGGSLNAACELVKKAGGIIDGCVVIMELTALKGRDKIDAPVYSFIQYDD